MIFNCLTPSLIDETIKPVNSKFDHGCKNCGNFTGSCEFFCIFSQISDKFELLNPQR